MVVKVLCVAEKPSIAKAVANHLSGGTATLVSRLDVGKTANRLHKSNRQTAVVLRTSRITSLIIHFRLGDPAMLS